jgi:hypothetical protein
MRAQPKHTHTHTHRVVTNTGNIIETVNTYSEIHTSTGDTTCIFYCQPRSESLHLISILQILIAMQLIQRCSIAYKTTKLTIVAPHKILQIR